MDCEIESVRAQKSRQSAAHAARTASCVDLTTPVATPVLGGANRSAAAPAADPAAVKQESVHPPADQLVRAQGGAGQSAAPAVKPEHAHPPAEQLVRAANEKRNTKGADGKPPYERNKEKNKSKGASGQCTRCEPGRISA